MKKILVTTAVVVACLLLSGKLFDRSYKKYWWPFFDKLDVVIKDSSYYDGIYLGDSRVHFGINPRIVDSITGLTSYNAGIGGAPINEILFLTRNYLSHHAAPRYAVLSVGYSNILKPERLFENPCYYFFYTSDPATENALQKLHYHTGLYDMLPVLKYTAFDDFNKLSMAEGLKGNSIVKAGGVVYNGFINNMSNSFNIQQLEKYVETDTACYTGIGLLEETIQLLASKKTIPILVYPPSTHSEGRSKNLLERKIDSAVLLLAAKYRAPVLHYDEDADFTNVLFTDAWHLNIKGTELYSQKIAADISTIIGLKK